MRQSPRFPTARFPTAVLSLALLAAGCGSDTAGPTDSLTPTSTPPPATIDDPSIVPVADRQAPNGDPNIAGDSITQLGTELFAAVRSETPDVNVTVSQASLVVALAMLEPGTTGDAQTQLRELLGITDAQDFHAAMNALEQDLEARVADAYGEGGESGEVTMRIANAAYLQEGYPFEAAYLDAIGSNYGPVLTEVDFGPDPDAIAHQINDWVAENTNDKITDLIADGVIKPESVLALVNALYLKASWQTTFEESATTDAPFTLVDGTAVTVPLMNGWGSSSAQGDGWVGATKVYVGGLSAQFILPDDGRFEGVAADLDAVFATYDEQRLPGGPFALPRFEARYTAEVSAALQSLGLTAPYAEGNLLGVANDPNLKVDNVIQETFVAMDEEGTEAAAATVVLAGTTSAPIDEPVPVILDRPFFYRIVDDRSGTTLFIGQILNPS